MTVAFSHFLPSILQSQLQGPNELFNVEMRETGLALLGAYGAYVGLDGNTDILVCSAKQATQKELFNIQIRVRILPV